MSASGSQNQTSKPVSTFEFTKRKRWADILITGLTDVILLILSPEGKVLYCGTAVTELLGWAETDIIDLYLTEFIPGEAEKLIFRRSFEHSILTNTELLEYCRLRCNPGVKVNTQSDDVLFEVKGYPHFVKDLEQGPECKCFFAMAKPYPSRNVAMLNTYLEQKIENERLQQCVAALKAQLNNKQMSPITNPNPIYATSSLQYANPYPGAYDKMRGLPGTSLYDGVYAGNHDSTQNQSVTEEADEGSRKKKAKKSHGIEQYVCRKCGRVDSPEWRKGPDGPKTLCNACGLRWAKQMRKFDEPSGGDEGTSGQVYSNDGST